MKFVVTAPEKGGAEARVWGRGLVSGLRQLGHEVVDETREHSTTDLLDLLAAEPATRLVSIDGARMPPGATDHSPRHEAVADRIILLLLRHPSAFTRYVVTMPARVRIGLVCPSHLDWMVRCWAGHGRPFFLEAAGAAGDAQGDAEGDAIGAAARDFARRDPVLLLGPEPGLDPTPEGDYVSRQILRRFCEAVEAEPLTPVLELYRRQLDAHGVDLPADGSWQGADREAFVRTFQWAAALRRRAVWRLLHDTATAAGLEPRVASDAAALLASLATARFWGDTSAPPRAVSAPCLAAMAHGTVPLVPRSPWAESTLGSAAAVLVDGASRDAAAGRLGTLAADADGWTRASRAAVRAATQSLSWSKTARRLCRQVGV